MKAYGVIVKQNSRIIGMVVAPQIRSFEEFRRHSSSASF
jgi:hypothetical protein